MKNTQHSKPIQDIFNWLFVCESARCCVWTISLISICERLEGDIRPDKPSVRAGWPANRRQGCGALLLVAFLLFTRTFLRCLYARDHPLLHENCIWHVIKLEEDQMKFLEKSCWFLAAFLIISIVQVDGMHLLFLASLLIWFLVVASHLRSGVVRGCYAALYSHSSSF